jgi:hypothetical protein
VLSTIPNTIVVFQAHYNRSREHPDYIPFNAYSPSGLVRVSITSCNMCTFFPFDLFYNYLCNQCISPLLTKVVSLNPVHGKVNSMQHYIKFVSDLRQVGTPGTPVSSTDKTDLHDIAEILLKVTLNTITPLIFLLVYMPECKQQLTL